MSKRRNVFLVFLVSAILASGFFMGSPPELKGEWIAINADSSFYKSDTLVLMKCTNIDKEAPVHRHRRGFIEYTYAFQNYTDFIEFKFRSGSVAKISNVVTKTGTTTEYKFHDGIWEVEGRVLKIRSRDFRLNYAFLSSEERKFTLKGKEYFTQFLRFRRLLK